MKRRDFIMCVGVALAWPIRTRAQQADRSAPDWCAIAVR